MRLSALCWASLAIALPAFALAASQRDPVQAGTISSDMPPARFQGNAGVVVYFTDREGLNKYCGVAQPGYVIAACHRKHESGVSVLFMPNPCLGGGLEFYSKLACHELGHANGWSGDHEQ